MRALLYTCLALAILFGSTAAAQPRGSNVVVFLPEHRRTIVQGAFRVELSGDDTRLEFRDLSSMGSDLGAHSHNARQLIEQSTFVVWIEFPSGLLAPAELRVQGPTDAAPRYAMLPLAYDLTEPRLIAITAATLLDYVAAEPPAHETNPPMEATVQSAEVVATAEPAASATPPAAVGGVPPAAVGGVRVGGSPV